MLVSKLNRDKLQRLSDAKIEEARVLLDNKCWTGAYYQTGLAVECALKARLARGIQQYDFPDKNFINKVYTHNVEDLVRLDSWLSTELEKEMEQHPELESNWKVAFDWKDEMRYEFVEESTATSLYKAITEPGSGVMEWIRRRW